MTAGYCEDCEFGKYSLTGAECLWCAAGSYTGKAVAADSCTACNGGTFSSEGSVNCSVCPPGRHSGTRDSSCSPCVAGYYNDKAGASSCTACAAGTISTTENATGCDSCKLGRYQFATGSTSCTIALPGFFVASPGSSFVSACTAPAYSREETHNCTLCVDGYYFDTDGARCTLCELPTSATQC